MFFKPNKKCPKRSFKKNNTRKNTKLSGKNLLKKLKEYNYWKINKKYFRLKFKVSKDLHNVSRSNYNAV